MIVELSVKCSTIASYSQGLLGLEYNHFLMLQTYFILRYIAILSFSISRYKTAKLSQTKSFLALVGQGDIEEYNYLLDTDY
eukprot:snap_masked-scaffold_23-processed-gene-1.42-mRNA-1 protein AED:1.00 eAED:1.00 QI:0/0/0/0/1/1/2/0/80